MSSETKRRSAAGDETYDSASRLSALQSSHSCRSSFQREGFFPENFVGAVIPEFDFIQTGIPSNDRAIRP